MNLIFSQQTSTDLRKAANFIATDEDLWNMPECAKDLNALKGLGSGSPAGPPGPADIIRAASNVQFNNANTTSPPAPPGFVGPVPPASYFFVPGQYAAALLNSNQQYWLPGTTILAPGTASPMSPGRLDGMVLHELLHNLGYSDTAIQSAFGIFENPLDTDNISRELSLVCFPHVL